MSLSHVAHVIYEGTIILHHIAIEVETDTVDELNIVHRLLSLYPGIG